MRITAGSRRALVIVGAACAIGAALIVALGREGAAAQVAAPPFAVLERPQVPADLAPDKRITVRRIAQDMPEAVVAGARVVSETAEEALVLIPRSDGQLCLARLRTDGGAAITCQPLATAQTAGLFFNGPGAGVGVVPDQVHAVDFGLSGGGSVTVPVAQNTLRAPPEAVEGRVPTGSGVARVPFIPRSALPPGVVVSPSGEVSRPG